MRVLRLGVDGNRQVELHPAVTVVSGLDAAAHGALRQAFAAIGAGVAPEVPGLLEAHGVLLDLDQDALDLLDVADVPADVVVTSTHPPGALPADAADRLCLAERDVRSWAAERRRAADRVAAWAARSDPSGGGGPEPLIRRAAELRLALHLARTTDPEPVRAALDHVGEAVRTAARAGTGADLDGPAADVASALADVGLDLRQLDVPLPEVVRVADDWLDDVRRRAGWAVGAAVELQGIEGRLAAPGWHVGGHRGDHVDVGVEVGRASEALADATRRLGEALRRAELLRCELAATAAPVDPAELQWYVLGRLGDHRQARIAGAVPLVLDEPLRHVADDGVDPLLDRIARLAGSVQLVVLDDDPRLHDWADRQGPGRAAVVAPGPIDPAEVAP